MTYQFCASKVIFQFDGSSVQLVLLRQHMLENINCLGRRYENGKVPCWRAVTANVNENLHYGIVGYLGFFTQIIHLKARSFIYANKKQDFIEFEVMLKLSFSLHEFQFIGRHGAFARQMIAWFMKGQKKQQQLLLLIESAKVAQKTREYFHFNLITY